METPARTTTTRGLSPHLERYGEQFARNRETARALAGRYGQEQMNWHPAPGKWSMADCLVHLCEAGELYVPIFAKAFADARGRGLSGTGPFNHGMMGRFMIRQIEPPARRKMSAPASMAAGLNVSRHDVSQVLARFDRLGEEIRRLIAEADGLSLEKIVIPSVISRFMRMNAAAWLEFTAAHERRHLWQAEQVASAPGFPR